MVRSLLLKSALLWIRILALIFDCSYAKSAVNRIRNSLTVCGIGLQMRIPLANIADSSYICGFHLHFVESTYILLNPLTIFESRSDSSIGFVWSPLHNKCTDKNNVIGFCTRILRKFCWWNHSNFGTCIKMCLWNPETYRHKSVRLLSAQFGLVLTDELTIDHKKLSIEKLSWIQ